MIKSAANKKGRGTSLSRQRKAIIVIAALCLVLAVTLIVVNFMTALRKFEYDGETFYVLRQKEDGKTVYIMTDKDRNPLDTTDDGYFITPSGALIAVDQNTGLASIYARPAVDGNEQLGLNDRILIFPYTKRAQTQSIKVVNSHGEFEFYRRRVFTDTDRTSYVCLLEDGEYHLTAPKDPTDPNSEFVEYERGADGYYTLLSGNKISINSRTGAIRSVAYTDFDGKVYSVKKNSEGDYILVRADGSAVVDTVRKEGNKTDEEGNPYVATLYDYYVTDYGTLVNVDKENGVISSWAVREYNTVTERYSTYHFVKKGDKYVLADAKGTLITETSIDDKDYYCTANNSYIAFNEDNGSYKVRVQKNYHLIANNDGVYALYDKNGAVSTNSAGYCALPDGQSYVYYDSASGSFSIMIYDGEKYTEAQSKLLNSISEMNVEGEFVIENFEDTDYDPSLFAALVTNGGSTLTPVGGKLDKPERLPDGSIDFSVYGLVECDRVDETGETYHHVPSYYVFTDLSGNVHKIIIGDKVVAGTGYYVRYEGINATEEGMTSLDKGEASGDKQVSHEAVYILLDNYSMGFTQTYETFYYYSISDTFLAPVENIVTPKVVPSTSTMSYFNVKDFVISKLNYDKLHGEIVSGKDDGDYRDIWINFSYYDIEERRNTVNAATPYVMGACELYGFNIDDSSVNTVLMAMMDLTCLGTKKLGPSYADLIKYGLDEPEYILYYELRGSGEKPMLLISKLTPNGTYYVYTEMYDMIVEIDRSALPFLAWSDNEWLTEDMFNTSVGFCDNIKLEAGNYWASFDLDMSLELEAKINLGTPSTFSQKVYCSDKRDNHTLVLSTGIHANTNAPVGTVEAIAVDFTTLQNYYTYIISGGKTTGMTPTEVTNLSAFIDTISEKEYDEKSGALTTMHNLTLTDGAGNSHLVVIMFSFDSKGEIVAYMRVNTEEICPVFSLDAYMAYEKIIYSDECSAAEKKIGYDFYIASGVTTTTKYNFDKVTGTNSDGVNSVFTEHKITKTDKDGKTTVDYCLSTDYRVFCDVNEEDLVGIASSFVRYYDMSDSKVTEQGAYETITQLPYKFKASQVRLVTSNSKGGTDVIDDGTLGEGSYTVEVTETAVIVTDENGNVTRYLRYAGTSVISNFYATFMWASYEGICEIPDEQKEAFIADDNAWNFKVTFDTKLNTDENGKGLQYVFKTYQYSERRSYITLNDKGDFFVLRTFIDKIVDSSKKVFDNVLIDASNRY